MSIIGWIILGLIAGFIASKIVNKQGEGFLLDIVLGIVGALVGGFKSLVDGHIERAGTISLLDNVLDSAVPNGKLSQPMVIALTTLWPPVRREVTSATC